MAGVEFHVKMSLLLHFTLCVSCKTRVCVFEKKEWLNSSKLIYKHTTTHTHLRFINVFVRYSNQVIYFRSCTYL